LNYLLAFKIVVWFTGNTYPGPITPYEEELTAFLNAFEEAAEEIGAAFKAGKDL